MILNKLKKHQKAIITDIKANEELEDRLFALGIYQGQEVSLDEYSLIKNSIILKINEQKIAIRLDEAKCIEVEKC